MAFPLAMQLTAISKILTAAFLITGIMAPPAWAQASDDSTLQYEDEDLSEVAVPVAEPSSAPVASPDRTVPSVTTDRYCPGANVYAGICRRINMYRAQYGLNPLRLDARLNVAAQQWSDEMQRQRMTIYNLEHDPNWASRVNQQLAGSRSYAASENISLNPYGVRNAVDSWMGSAGHRANILQTGIKRIGVGNTGIYWVTDFSN